MTPEEVAYVAGLFDGEGHIAIVRALASDNRTDPPRRYLRFGLVCAISLSRPGRETLEWIHRAFGGSLRYQEGKRSYDRGVYRRWDWRVASREAAAFLRAVRPLLRIKGEEADVALSFQATMGPAGRGRGVSTPQDVIEHRETAFLKIRDIRKRGVQ